MSAARYFRPFFDLVDASPAMREHVLRELSAPRRRWHGLLHHALMLRAIRSGRHDPGTLRRLVLATLFHDIVYEPRRSDNEKASAEVARGWIGGGDREPVAALILATKAHDLKTDPVTRALLMADLGVLWTPSERLYAYYARGIRAEYAHAPDEAYRAGRIAVLRDLGARLRPELPVRHAAMLDRNIGMELAALARGGML